jgi:transcriptional regulator with XRE-family HTH domain
MRDAIMNFIAEAEKAMTASNKATFRRVLLHAIEVLDLTDEEIAHKFGASRPTVTRWRNGANAPHAALHATVYRWLLSAAKARLRRVEQVAAERSRLDEEEAAPRPRRDREHRSSEHAISAAAAKH